MKSTSHFNLDLLLEMYGNYMYVYDNHICYEDRIIAIHGMNAINKLLYIEGVIPFYFKK